MKKSKFTDSQIMDAIKRAEAGVAVPEICRELGVSTATFYNWRSKYGGMDVSLMARMKELEAQNARLRKMYVACRSGSGHCDCASRTAAEDRKPTLRSNVLVREARCERAPRVS